MADLRAFKLKAGLPEGTSANFAYGAYGHTLYVGQELEKGEGIIITDDDVLGNALAECAILEPCELPEDATPTVYPEALPEENRPSEGATSPDIPAEHGEEELPAGADRVVTASDIMGQDQEQQNQNQDATSDPDNE